MPEPEEHKSAADTYAALISSIAGVIGILAGVGALDVARTWRVVAVLLGVAGVAGSLLSFRLRRRRPATVTGIALLVLAGGVLVLAPPQTAVSPPSPRALVRLSDLILTGGKDGRPVTLDVTVHNTGERRAVITGLDLRIQHFAYLPTCQSQGEIVHGPAYPLTMPDRPEPGTVVTAHLHEQVGPDQVDRFLVKVAAPPYRRASGGREAEGDFGYQVALSLSTDAQGPTAAGDAVLVVPFDPDPYGEVWNLADPRRHQTLAQEYSLPDQPRSAQQSLRKEGAQVEHCLDTNSRRLASLLRLPGERSSTVGQGLSAG